MKIVCISDTHLQHKFDVPEGDVLIHSGDATFEGTELEITKFFNWFNSLPHRTKIFVPGNHDWLFQTNETVARSLNLSPTTHILIDQSHLLLDESKSFKVYGSPWQPEFCGWAFNLSRMNDELKDKWAQIPDDTEILVTHGPPKGVLDSVPGRPGLGCFDLRERIVGLEKLKLHVFGHIHYSAGKDVLIYPNGPDMRSVLFVNAAIVDESYRARNIPIVVEL